MTKGLVSEDATQDWVQTGETVSDRYGWSCASAGDVNGDGYDDVIIGAYECDSGALPVGAGKAYIYHGSSAGLSGSADWTDGGEGINNNFGYAVASAGDVNGDGYDDVIVGAYHNGETASNAGKAYLEHLRETLNLKLCQEYIVTQN